MHGLNIIHGGVKDRVVLVDDSGRAYLSDFSQAYTEGTQFTSMPYIQNRACSLENIVWQAPELLEGILSDGPMAPSKASDLYALGCLAYKVHRPPQSS